MTSKGTPGLTLQSGPDITTKIVLRCFLNNAQGLHRHKVLGQLDDTANIWSSSNFT